METDIIHCEDCLHCFKNRWSETGYKCCVWGRDDFACDVPLDGYCYRAKPKTTTITLTPPTMTPEEFKQAMADAGKYGIEDDHIAMDNIMCSLLRSLGYGEGIDIFENTDKWYA